MKTFHCTHCQNLVFFENIRCLNCEHWLAYLPDQSVMAALRQGEDGLWRSPGTQEADRLYRRCDNYDRENVCNWAVPASDPLTLCVSCRLTRVIPDLSIAQNRTAWYRLELAKRRLLYTLLALRLPVVPQRNPSDGGLVFEFLRDSSGDGMRVMTGHDNGLITINIDEADDVLREQQRKRQGEPYRTLLGHFRHEVGHYYWDRLIRHDPERLAAFRALFGDERADYAGALRRHYERGPPANWTGAYISGYATCHPWEDWAESWAHFLHMTDTLETAATAGLSLRPKRADEPTMAPPPNPLTEQPNRFDRMTEDWLALTYVLNNLSRGLGLQDSYPFVLSVAVLAKLRFIHDIVYAPQHPRTPD
ncbi:MAG: putative zinc-binding metallopeptidase [Sinobacteraceae bacterium]|nr:putative zinc-binding metallopeptidase [Nevskiaceae bacterium]